MKPAGPAMRHREGTPPAPGDSVDTVSFAGARSGFGMTMTHLPLGPPSEGAKTFRARGKLLVSYAVRDVVQTLKVADIKDGAHVDFAATRITFHKVSATDRAFQLDTSTAGTFTGTPEFELLDAVGARVDSGSRSSSGSPGRQSQTWHMPGKNVETIRIRGFIGSRTIEVPFEWVDVPLPKEDE